MSRSGWGVWQFLGPGGGAGSLHIIVEVSAGWVTTWSQPNSVEDGDIAGWTWLGPMDAFHREFRRIDEPKRKI